MNLMTAAILAFLLVGCASTERIVETPSSRLAMNGVPYVTAASLFAGNSDSISAQETAFGLIRKRLGNDCPFQIQETMTSSIAANGHWSKLWRTSTCRGETLFQFNYWPPEFFPDFPGPFELKELVLPAPAR
jgi:hypothetical protein